MADTTALTLPGRDDTFAPYALAASSFILNYEKASTRTEYTQDLRVFFSWCQAAGLEPFVIQRLHLMGFVRYLADERHLMPATVGRRVGTVRAYYTHAVQERYLAASPAVGLKLPKVINDPTKRTWLNRYEMADMLKAARESSPTDLVLISLLGTLGMRVSAACNVQIEDIRETPGGYRAIHTIGKGDKPSLKALPVPVSQAVDAAVAARTSGPLLLRRDGTQMTRRSAATVVERLRKKAGISRPVHPHALRRSHATNLLKAGVPINVVRDSLDHADTRTTARYDAVGVELHAQASHLLAAMLSSAG